MPKKVNSPLTPEKVAEQFKKKWKAVIVPSSDMSPGDVPDAVSPELDTLKKRYNMAARSKKKQMEKKSSKMSMVVMEPRDASDTRVSRKTVLVENGKVVGEQG